MKLKIFGAIFVCLLFLSLVSAIDNENLVGRDAYSDIYLMDDGNYKSQIFAGKINMRDSNGEFKPYEEVTSFVETQDSLKLEWNGKIVELKFKGKKENAGFLEKKTIDLKNELNMKTEIKKNRANYYFDHRLETTNLGEFYYDIDTTKVNCIFENYKLICDEQVIDFSQAVYEQNLSVEGDNKKIRINGDNLSYIDPLVSLGQNESGGVFYNQDDGGDCPYSTNVASGYIGTEETSGDRERTIGWRLFHLNFSRGIDVSDLDINVSFGTFYDNSCSGDIELKVYQMNESTEDFSADCTDSEAVASLYSAADSGTFYNKFDNFGESDKYKWHSLDLGSSADTNLEETYNEGNRFAVGLTGKLDTPSSTYDCSPKVIDTSIIVTYELVEDIPPITTATANILPMNTTYTFNSSTPYNIGINLTCYDANSSCKSDSPKYCVDTTNTCAPNLNGSVIISNDGVNYIRYHSEDIKNNVENISSQMINISRDYSSLQLSVGDKSIWNKSENYFESEIVEGFTDEINEYLESCTADAEGYCEVPINLYSKINKTIELSDIKINYDILSYPWNISELGDGLNYSLRILGIGEYINTSWNVSGTFGINSSLALPDDTTKFIIDNPGETVAWLGDAGNIILKGNCFSGGGPTSCDNPGPDSLIFQNSFGENVAYINSTGDLCIETGDCTDMSVSCSSPNDSFIMENSTGGEMIVFDLTNGDLCLVGGLYENAEI